MKRLAPFANFIMYCQGHLYSKYTNLLFDLIFITVILFMINLTKILSKIIWNINSVKYNVSLAITGPIRGFSRETKESFPIFICDIGISKIN